MKSKKYHLHDGRHGAAVMIRITQNAPFNQVTEFSSDGIITINLAVGQEINATLISYLSFILGMPTSNIELVAGFESNQKLISFQDINPEEIQEKLNMLRQKNS